MRDSQRQRYSRQIRLPQMGESGQQKLIDAHVVIIGMGGLGSPVALYLAAAGVGQLTISDFDRVDESNLQRQIAHSVDDIGESKASSARASILAINPQTTVNICDYELDGDELLETFTNADVVADCTDNFPSRFVLNRASITTKTPLVSAAAIRFEGQVTTFNPMVSTSPCYQCLYPDEGIESATCAAEGVMSPVVGVLGTLQALEIINVITGVSEGLLGQLLLFDGLAMDFQTVRLPKNPNCPACGTPAQ